MALNIGQGVPFSAAFIPLRAVLVRRIWIKYTKRYGVDPAVSILRIMNSRFTAIYSSKEAIFDSDIEK